MDVSSGVKSRGVDVVRVKYGFREGGRTDIAFLCRDGVSRFESRVNRNEYAVPPVYLHDYNRRERAKTNILQVRLGEDLEPE